MHKNECKYYKLMKNKIYCKMSKKTVRVDGSTVD